jgi:hypothetical protein
MGFMVSSQHMGMNIENGTYPQARSPRYGPTVSGGISTRCGRVGIEGSCDHWIAIHPPPHSVVTSPHMSEISLVSLVSLSLSMGYVPGGGEVRRALRCASGEPGEGACRGTGA